jgi:Putative phage tail protein
MLCSKILNWANMATASPSLSFEVIADEGDVHIGTIINSLSPAHVQADCPTAIGGFAALGDSIAAVCQTLQSAIPFYVRDDGTVLRVVEAEQAPIALTEHALGASAGKRDVPRIAIDQLSAGQLPSRVLLSHFEPERDYQLSSQQARRSPDSRRTERIEFAATLTAGTARQLAERNLAQRWTGRKRANVQLPWRYAKIVPGMAVLLPQSPELWHVQAVTFEKMAVSLNLVRSGQAAIQLLPASGGRGVLQPDLTHGPTRLMMLDLPPLEDDVRTRPLVAVAAAGVSAGWRRAALIQSLDDGTSWQEIGQTAAPAIMGNSVSALAVGAADILDVRNSVDVELLNDGMQVSPADDEGLLSGRNLAMIGTELIQFGSATPLGNRRYRLSRLLRGRRGTSVQPHASGAGFALIDRDALTFLDVPIGAPSVRIIATGVGDPITGVEASLATPHRAITPLAPVHVAVQRDGSGGFAISWVRQSRDGWRWIDGVDAPLAEETERYRVEIAPNSGAPRTIETLAPQYLYPSVEKSADAAAGATSIQITVSQIGTLATSPPATLSFSIL